MENTSVYIEILKVNWQHARHVESERMWFANIFSAIIVGTAAYLTQTDLEKMSIIPLIVLIIFALFCLLVTVKLNAAFGEHIKGVESLFEDKKIDIGEEKDWRKYMGLPVRKGLIWKICRVGRLNIAFYILIILLLLAAIIGICIS